ACHVTLRLGVIHAMEDDTTLSTAALRDFSPLYVRFGSQADRRHHGAMSALPPKADIVSWLDMSASCQKRTHAVQRVACSRDPFVGAQQEQSESADPLV